MTAIDKDAGDGSLEKNIFGSPFYSLGETKGLGDRKEISFGMAYLLQGMGAVRYQFLGEPYGFEPRQGGSRFPVDASIEVGASVSYTFIYFADIYFGFNLSVPVGRVTPYFSYRLHWYWVDPYELYGGDHWSSPQQMFFAGLDYLKPDQRRAIAVELFYGRPPDMTPEGDVRVSETVGLNVIFRRFDP